jgi:hypothetical protein
MSIKATNRLFIHPPAYLTEYPRAPMHAPKARVTVVHRLRLCRLRIALLVLPDAAKESTHAGADRSALAGISADGSAHGANSGTAGAAAQDAAGCRRGRSASLIGVIPGLLHRPDMAVTLIAVLLLGTLALRRIVVLLLRQAGRHRSQQHCQDPGHREYDLHSTPPALAGRGTLYPRRHEVTAMPSLPR